MLGAQIKEFFKPLWVKIVVPVVGGVAAYDGISSQFNTPKLGSLLGASGSLLPWWGWLIAFQSIMIVGLFEYVRRNVPVVAAPEMPTNATARFAAIDAKLEDVRVDSAVNQRDLQKLAEEVKRQNDRTLGSLHAVFAREQLAFYDDAIGSDARDLYDSFRNGDRYDHARWQTWESVHTHWESMLTGWLNTAKWYVRDLEVQITTVDESEYRSAQWTVSDHQFPNSEAVRLFKRHRMIHGKWENLRKTVNDKVHQVAFEGMTEHDVKRAGFSGGPIR